MGEATAVAVEAVSTEAAVAVDFMGVAADFTAEEDSPAGTLGLAAAVRLTEADSEAALMADEDLTGDVASMAAAVLMEDLNKND